MYKLLKPNIYDCTVCPTRCDGKTVPKFDFERDVNFSESVENKVIAFINEKYPHLTACKTTTDGYPDIEIRRSDSSEICLFLEIKVQSRTFMSVRKYLPASELFPSETLALNLSDLERYFAIKDKTNLPVYITWLLINRPCITSSNATGKKFFTQKLDVLREIRLADKNNNRRFRRASGDGDVVDGIHKGVVVNYHFSLNELVEGLPDLTFL